MNLPVSNPVASDNEIIRFTLNGQRIETNAPLAERLSEALRERLDCRDVKIGCNAGDCGACTVLVDGAAVCACTTAVGRVDGCDVKTLRGLIASDNLTARLADAFQRHGAAQCGICTPAMIVTATHLLRAGEPLDEVGVMDGLGGVLCRCTGYRKIIDAVLDVSRAGATPVANLASGHAGQAIARLDGLAKVRGDELFGDDVAPSDSLVLRVVRSPFPHASFRFGDLEHYRREHPGLEMILTASDVPGKNCFGVIAPFADQPVFAENYVRFPGEAVAAVIGSPGVILALDLDLFPIKWEQLARLMGIDEALQAGAKEIHPGRAGNIMCSGKVVRGDVDAAMAASDAAVEGRFTTGFIEHAYLEPEAGFAQRVGDRLEIHASTQAPYMDRDSMAEIMGLLPEQVRIVPTACGGGFGSKLDLSMQPFIGLAAWLTGRPVRITYSRTESMQSTTKRHPSDMILRVGASRDGKITGIDFAGDFNTGAYASWGPTVTNRVPVHASGPYFVPHYRAKSRAIHTHSPPSGAFRGFGVPQTSFALESLLDELAGKLGLDRLAFRRLNALDNHQPTVTGQIFEKGVGIGACLDVLQGHWNKAIGEADIFNAQSASSGSAIRRGVGVASAWYGCGNTSLPNPSTIRAGLRSDGKIVLHQGAVDIGQGANTVITQIFATALGVSVHDCVLVGPDTDLTPDAGKTSASRQTFVTGNAARRTGASLRARILRLGNVSDDAEIILDGSEIRLTDGGEKRVIDLRADLFVNDRGYVLEAEESYDPPTRSLDENGQGDPYAVYGYAAHMVQLNVDMVLGTVRVLAIHAAHDVGKAINPMLIEGQVEGGIAQGLGMALMEEYFPGRTENLHDYLIPTFGDMPKVHTLIVEVEDGHGPYGAKGLGEHVLIPTAPAILNAIRHATGARIYDLPATPPKVFAAIRAARRDGRMGHV